MSGTVTIKYTFPLHALAADFVAAVRNANAALSEYDSPICLDVDYGVGEFTEVTLRLPANPGITACVMCESNTVLASVLPPASPLPAVPPKPIDPSMRLADETGRLEDDGAPPVE